MDQIRVNSFINFFKFNRIHSILFIILFCVPNAGSWGWKRDPSYKLFCYKGSKLIIGHDPREENVECTSMLGSKQYCYRFIAHNPINDIVKLGCARVLCSPFRNTCAEFEMGGVAGTLCCCNDSSYCNGATSRQAYTLLFTYIFSFSFYMLKIAF